MRVDYQTTSPFSKEEVMKYMYTLIEIQKTFKVKMNSRDNLHIL